MYANETNCIKWKKKFLEIHKTRKWTKEEIENLNRPITMRQIELGLGQSLLTNQSSGPDDLNHEFHQTCKEQLRPILLKHCQKIEKKEGFVINSMRLALS